MYFKLNKKGWVNKNVNTSKYYPVISGNMERLDSSVGWGGCGKLLLSNELNSMWAKTGLLKIASLIWINLSLINQ